LSKPALRTPALSPPAKPERLEMSILAQTLICGR
jgi:hypothetical protein